MSHGNHKFGTTLNCMDGRSVGATVGWMKKEYGVDFVDDITEPGMDGLIGKMTDEERAYLKRKLAISITNHGSRIVSVVGHDDCAGNPVDEKTHCACIATDVELTKDLIKEIDPQLSVEVIGLWAHSTEDPQVWTVEKI